MSEFEGRSTVMIWPAVALDWLSVWSLKVFLEYPERRFTM